MTELVGTLIHEAASRTPDAPALICDDDVWTFSELAARIEAFSAALRQRLDDGARVAVLSENTPEFVVAYYAVPHAGMSLVHLNYRLSPAELTWQIEHSETALVLAQPHLAETIAHLDPPLEDLEVFGQEPATATPSPPAAAAWIIYTSGTTGRPKGVTLTDANLLASVATSSVGRAVADDDIYLFPFPLCHVSGYNLLLQHQHGRPVVLLRRFDTAELITAVERWGVTTMSVAPTMVAMLLEDPRLPDADLSSLRVIGYGASPISATVLQRAIEAFGCGFNQGYGMTELSGNATFLTPADHEQALLDRPDLLVAAGRPGPGVEIRIAASGEILARGAQVCTGYLDDPETTAATIVDGWLHTGDVGRIDDDGYLYVIDRLKDIIVSGGENVASREVEDVLAAHPAVRDVAVVGEPHAVWGEQVVAHVVATSAGPDFEADLISFARERLAGYKCPKRVELRDSLPKNTAGKVQKAALRSA